MASLNTVRGISQISSLGPAPSILYATCSLLSSHAIACKYCWYSGPPKDLSSMIYTLVVPLKRTHLVIACGNFRSGCLPKNIAAPFLAMPLSVNSSKFSNICLSAVDGLSCASVRKSFIACSFASVYILNHGQAIASKKILLHS